MAKLKDKSSGEVVEIELLPAHFISKSLDTFLVSDEPHKLIEATIFLSIGIETYIKSSIEKKEQKAINHLDSNRWGNIKEKFLINHSKKDKRDIINESLKQYLKPLKNNRTLDYGIALEIFPIYFNISQNILKDLNEVKGYRNGLFHWKAKDESSFKLTKRLLRLFEWLFKFIKKQNGWWLGNEFNIIDPNGQKRIKFNELKQFNNNEPLLTLKRRINKHQSFYKERSLVNARKNGDVFIPNAIEWKTQSCIACNHHNLEIYFSGNDKGRQYFLECKNCDFNCTSSEFDLLKAENFPSLENVVGILKKAPNKV